MRVRPGLVSRRSRLVKKWALSRTTGPPTTPPNSYLLFSGLSLPACWVRKSVAVIAVDVL